MTNQIWVPRKVAGEEFYADRLDEALRTCQTPTKEAPKGYEAQFMPEIIDTRIASPGGSRIWQTWFTAPSIRATGKSRQGKPFVVYAHIPNYFSKHKNITKAIEQGLVNGAGRMPQDEFQRLLDLKDDERVFVVNYEVLRSAESGVIPVSKALAHPQTIPFLGGRERAEAYLPQHEKNYGSKIGNWHLNDFIEDSPLARALFVDGGYVGGLCGCGILNGDARFLGVRAEGAAQKFSPSAEQLTNLINEYVAPINQPEVHNRISAVFR
nr:hypothetical protein [uncultured archaeon]AQS29502.1 hypothetical protein [uncultured archaeon]AQS29702.1 hypothetical protein [uncultured archaeon]